MNLTDFGWLSLGMLIGAAVTWNTIYPAVRWYVGRRVNMKFRKKTEPA